jgi:hypothetical protein
LRAALRRPIGLVISAVGLSLDDHGFNTVEAAVVDGAGDTVVVVDDLYPAFEGFVPGEDD